ncbi:hypothetical protein VaNZ11_008963 [Volvox africanus]|uniref:DUF1826 domain-containing protein n=1 Tax=Volvox africanus TaxID=51714 RepID=A0ABQ5S879_9CHLO|nr:hypothetical protein VaNZ11_008963 [Volvox africanus]
MGFEQLHNWARAQYMHDRVRVSTSSPADLLRPDVNIVHLPRCSPVHPKHLLRQAEELGIGFKARVLARTEAPRAAVSDLTRDLTVPEVREWLQDDIAELVDVFGAQLGYSEVSVKLEVLGNTPCPRFHADHVGVRLLVTYYGPGTVYVENRHVRRRWLWGHGGGIAVETAGAESARQADAADLLFLKGHAALGNYGMGAVHRSPDLDLDLHPESGRATVQIATRHHPASEARFRTKARAQDIPEGTGGHSGIPLIELPAPPPPVRLLLTVDDVVGWAAEACGCGHEHPLRGQGVGKVEGVGAFGTGRGMEQEAGAHRPDASIHLMEHEQQPR